MNTGHKHYINTCIRNGNGVIELWERDLEHYRRITMMQFGFIS
jgi:hypothetical protein